MSSPANVSEVDRGSKSTLKILIADDNHSDRLILQTIVKRQNHTVVTAVDGVEAVEKFTEERPDIVLLDALMPRKDGFEAARDIKRLAGEDLIPIIFLTSLSDAESLAKCLEAGGDDFLSKPYNQIILQAKIKAFDRMRKMHSTLQLQRDQIAENNKHLLREQQVAKTVFDNVAHLGCLGAVNIQHLLSPLSVFNGDVLLACQKPSGDMHVLLGDFTGHGLPAAIGAMPLAEIFYGMTTKGYSLANILAEINQKLKAILPVGFFCCACMVELRFEQKEIEIWIGGLPECFLLRGDTLEKIKSNHLPLGILKAESFDTSTYRYEMNDGDRFYMWSDGIIESTSPEGELYGEKRLETMVEQHIRSKELFDTIKQEVISFAGESGPTDDLTMVEVTMIPEQDLGVVSNPQTIATLHGPKQWEFSYRLIDDSLANFDPIPLLLQIVVEVPGLRSFTGQIFTIISELYSNALDHGVLGLDSKLKSGSDGFGKYYRMREERLRKLENDYISIRIMHTGYGEGGRLTFRIEDSGAGFDFSSRMETMAQNNAAVLPANAGTFSGRGISLLSSLCSRIAFEGRGNIAEVDFEWEI